MRKMPPHWGDMQFLNECLTRVYDRRRAAGEVQPVDAALFSAVTEEWLGAKRSDVLLREWSVSLAFAKTALFCRLLAMGVDPAVLTAAVKEKEAGCQPS